MCTHCNLYCLLRYCLVVFVSRSIQYTSLLSFLQFFCCCFPRIPVMMILFHTTRVWCTFMYHDKYHASCDLVLFFEVSWNLSYTNHRMWWSVWPQCLSDDPPTASFSLVAMEGKPNSVRRNIRFVISFLASSESTTLWLNRK